ncbi:MAG: hypothetical protein HY306_08410 [Nitrosomonadales bacterium]|nr:hypothetical protein [Nitrosomonadales bacterium]
MKLGQIKSSTLAGAVFLAAGLIGSANSCAEEDRFTFNGFGNQDYRRSTANSYLGADTSGTWDNNFLGLVMSGKLNEKSRVWAQLQATTKLSPRFTWMFADYQVSDSVNVHVGRIKFPFGLYNETISTQALRPSIAEPVVYAQAADMTYDAYHGIGLDWNKGMGTAGNMLVQVFGGNIYVEPERKETALRDVSVMGGRVTYNTPVDGLRLMLSGNRTTVEAMNDSVVPSGVPTGEKASEDRLMLSLDYVAHDWDVKAEYNYHNTPALLTQVPPQLTDVKSRAYYVQVAYDMGKYTPYARYDYVNVDTTLSSDPANYQKIYVLGIGYKLADNVNLRVEQHFNHGYALGAAEMAAISLTPKVNWNTTMFSANFMF